MKLSLLGSFYEATESEHGVRLGNGHGRLVRPRQRVCARARSARPSGARGGAPRRAPSRPVELLVNNAGVASYGPFSSIPAERELELVRLNVEAIVALTRGLLPTMLERGRGGVINVASQMAFQPMPYFAAYAASKAFVLSFSEALAEELRGTGVRVTTIAPGVVSTEFAQVAGSHEPERRFPHLQPRRVVESALRAHDRGRTVKVVGALYSFLTFAGRFAPRAVLRRMMGRALRPTPTRRSGSRGDPTA